MKQHLQTLFEHAFDQLKQQGIIPQDAQVTIYLERTKDPKHGDFACNLAMMLAKHAKRKPTEIAQQLIQCLPTSIHVAKAEIAGPGFINIFLASEAYHSVIESILREKENYGKSQMEQNQSVLIEFVSANPTGPLHIGHGRGAAYGAALANLLQIAGYRVHKEYYVNDAGRQMDILATSIWLRYLDLCGVEITFPVNGYKGDYIWDIAATLHRDNGNTFFHETETIFQDIPSDEPQGGDKETHVDALIARCKQLLGDGYSSVFALGVNTILEDIRQDLEQFGVVYDEWFSEQGLVEHQTVQYAIEQLQQAGYTYTQEGALWFRSSDFEDEKDRVLVRENGQITYFASDIAYHLNKLERGFDKLIDIWGADHHGYVPRVKASIKALGADENRLTIQLVQFATLYRGKEKLAMSTRSGEFVTLRELRQEVGKDAARFFYIQRKSEQHLDFDLELAKSQTSDNPVYYIQYAHARIASVLRQLEEKQQAWTFDNADLKTLTNEHEQALLKTLARYPETVESAAQSYAPHQIAHYLRDLAQDFHVYYNAHTFLVDDESLRNARLSLITAVQQVLRNGLGIIGVSAPDVM